MNRSRKVIILFDSKRCRNADNHFNRCGTPVVPKIIIPAVKTYMWNISVSREHPFVKDSVSVVIVELHFCMQDKNTHRISLYRRKLTKRKKIHCSKYLREQIFKAIYFEIYWEKSFQIVVLFM